MKDESEIKDWLKRTEKLMAEGQTKNQACKEVGWSPSAFYYHRHKALGKKKPKRVTIKPRKLAIPIAPESPMTIGKLCAFIGSPREVVEAIRAIV